MLNTYLTSLQAVGKSPVTIKNYRSQLVKFTAWLEDQTGSADLTDIVQADVVAYRDYLQHDRGLKAGSVNTALATIEAFCVWLVENGHLSENPLDKVKKLDQVRSAPKWLDKNEKHRVIRAAQKENKRNESIILTLLFSGLRVSELANLTLEDVLIRDRSGSITVRSGKGNKTRVVAIPEQLREVLGEYIVEHRSMSKWLFGSQRGERLTDKGVQHLCADIGRKAKIDRLTPHRLRHTFLHDLVSKGVSLDRVALLAGHSKLETTMIYTQPGQAELQADVEKLNIR